MAVTDLKVRNAKKKLPKKPPSRSRVEFDPGLATAFRKLCRFEKATADGMLDTLIRYWVKHERPMLELVEEEGSEYEPVKSPRRNSLFRDTHVSIKDTEFTIGEVEKRTGPATRRTTTKRRGKKTPIPGSSSPDLNRRKKPTRRGPKPGRRKKD